MNPLQTGIAVALGLAVIGVFFIFPGLSPFGVAGAPTEPAAIDAGITTTDQTQTQSQTTTTMPIEDNGQLQIQDEIVGTGPALAPGDTVMIKYTGSLINGTVFDSSDAHGGTPLTLVVAPDGSLHTPDGGGLIEGWSKGVVGMKEGGTRRLIIPAALGYGAQAMGNLIPANSTLVFVLELVKVQKGSAQ